MRPPKDVVSVKRISLLRSILVALVMVLMRWLVMTLRRAEEALHASELAQQRLAFLAEASITLASSLDYEATTQQVAQLAVPLLADWCVVDLFESDQTMRPIAVTHVNPAKQPLAYALMEHYHSDLPSDYQQGLRAGRSITIPEVTDGLLLALAANDEHLRMLREMEVRSYIVVPLLARGQAIGILACAVTESRRRYTPADTALIEDLALRAAQAIDNARLYREAQDAIRVRDQFLSVASHELKGPLTSLLGFAQVLQTCGGPAPLPNQRYQQSLDVIATQAERLSRMIDLLLDATRIEAGRITLDRQIVDLGLLARQVVEEVQPTLDRHTVALHCVDEPVVVVGDELRLEQVLRNLIQNAIRYSPDGGPVTVRVERQGDRACVAVRDQGLGIPQEALPQLFRRFYRVQRVGARQIGGLGIGLYLAKEIVSLHGGTVEVNSREHEGSTFTVSLPLPTRERERMKDEG
jgi:signal transduction histidine kinase